MSGHGPRPALWPRHMPRRRLPCPGHVAAARPDGDRSSNARVAVRSALTTDCSDKGVPMRLNRPVPRLLVTLAATVAVALPAAPAGATPGGRGPAPGAAACT